MCWALRVRRAAPGAGERRAGATARPVNNQGRDGPDTGSRVEPAADGAADRRSEAPDKDSTRIMPAVIDSTAPDLRDPIEAVTAALNGAPRDDDRPLSGARQQPEPQQRRASGDQVPGGRRPSAADILAALRGDLQQLDWVWIRRGLYAAGAVLLVLPVITFAMAYLVVDIPKPGDIRTNQVSTILASDGSELAKIVPPEGNRVDIGLAQVPVHVRNAVLAAEDRDFYSNPGFSFSGFVRAVKNNMFGGDTQGGSTITQQYVKNALVGSQRAGLGGLMRKAKELVIATKMSRAWSKDEVLESYLNIIYFGRGAYGIAAAAKAYFDEPVERLDVAQGALLAALIERQVTKELLDLFNIDEQTLNTQGLQITTTIDSQAQQAAEDAVTKYLDGLDPATRAAVVSIDPRSGAVRAYYGGADANGFDFAQAGRSEERRVGKE